MPRRIYVLGICFATLVTASQVSALTITNRDTTDHKLVVTEDGATQEVTLKPSQMLDSLCAKGCTIKMSDGEEYEFDGTEIVSIEEGLMFLDEPSDSTTDIGGDNVGKLDEPADAENKN